MIQCKAYHTLSDEEVTRICKIFRNDVFMRIIQIHICCSSPKCYETQYHVFVEFENLSQDTSYIPEI